MSEKIKVLTGQYVRVNYTAASFGRRLLAYIIDMIVPILILLALFFLVGAIEKWSRIVTTLTTAIDFDIFPLILFSAVLIWFLSKPAMEYFNNGRSLGNICTGTMVVMRNGSALTFSACMLRHLLLTIDTLFYGIPAIISYCNTKDKQRLGDLAAGTVVVRTSLAGSENVSLRSDFKYTKTGYKVTYPEAELLSYEEACEISNALFKNKHDINRIASKYKSKLKVRLKTSTTAVKFLDTLWNDYHFIQIQ